jgi:hypothetical protein
VHTCRAARVQHFPQSVCHLQQNIIGTYVSMQVFDWLISSDKESDWLVSFTGSTTKLLLPDMALNDFKTSITPRSEFHTHSVTSSLPWKQNNEQIKQNMYHIHQVYDEYTTSLIIIMSSTHHAAVLRETNSHPTVCLSTEFKINVVAIVTPCHDSITLQSLTVGRVAITALASPTR